MRTRLFFFVSIVQAILFLTHWFVYATVAYFWGSAASTWGVKLAFGLLSISFVLASLRGWYSFHPLVRLWVGDGRLRGSRMRRLLWPSRRVFVHCSTPRGLA